MNDLVLALGLQTWKPYLLPWLLPPVPWLALVGLGILLGRRRRRLGTALALAGAAAIWASGTTFCAETATHWLLAPPEDPPALAEAINKILTDPAAAQAMGQYARMLADTRYSWIAVAERMKGVFEKL